MAYSTSNPPRCVVPGVSGANAVWMYASADVLADVNTSGYFTDGYDLGMKAGDVVMIVSDTTPKQLAMSVVVEATSTTVDLGDGTVLSSADAD